MLDNNDKYFNELHGESKGYITIASKNGKWQQNSMKLQNINYDQIAVGTDVYISQNTFSMPNRRLINLLELNAIYIDIDCYKANLTKEGALFFLQDLYGEIPIPNYIIDSGRGLYYVIILKDKASSEKLALWKTIEIYLYEKLKHLGADPKCLEATRVLRAVGSNNSKSASKVEVLEYYEYDYTLEEIQEHYIPDLNDIVEKRNKIKKTIKKKRGRPKKLVSIYNLHKLYFDRISDLETLCKLRSYNLKGHREQLLFLYRYFSNIFYFDTEEALLNTLELNNRFIEPLKEQELITDTQSADRYYKENKYKYSNDKLIRLLDITIEEQRYLKTIISTREKYDRNNERRKRERRTENGITKSKAKQLEKIEQVKKLRASGKTYQYIADYLGVSLRTVKNYAKK